MMHSRSRLLLVVTLLVVGTLALPWAASGQEPVTSRLKLSIGGYIKPEMIYKTKDGGVGLAGSIPGAQNFGFTAVPQSNTLAHDNGRFVAAANESRFNFTLTAPDWRGIKPTAFLEMDFEGDTASTIERFCQERDAALSGGSPCVRQQAAGNPAGSINNGGFRIRHAFFRLAGEGMGGSWQLNFGQTWGIFGMLPYYSGSTLSFGGASIFGQRQPQLSLRHTVKFFRDFAWENSVGVMSDTTNLNEMPAFDASSRLIYSGWQGWQGGSRTPTNLGISARVQRQKADVEFQPAGSVLPGTATSATHTLSNTAWGLTGGIFLPILPGTSATDRTWALSVLSEAGYGEGVNSLIPGTNPLPGLVTAGPNFRADPGAVYFHPGKCSFFAGPFPFTLPVGTAGNPPTCGGGPQETELSLIQSRWTSYNVQFYLPWNFWLSGGQKWIWFTNPQNATDSTCVITATGACGVFVVPVQQGRSWLGPPGGAFTGLQGAQIVNNASALYGGKDSVIKRQTYSYITVFYDMTPNIRWGFEWGMHGTNRRDSAQDGTSHRFQLGAYYFF